MSRAVQNTSGGEGERTSVDSQTVSPVRVLRGLRSRKSDLMEQLQRSYLHAVAAAAGVEVLKGGVDSGVDAVLDFRGAGQLLGRRRRNTCRESLSERLERRRAGGKRPF